MITVVGIQGENHWQSARQNAYTDEHFLNIFLWKIKQKMAKRAGDKMHLQMDIFELLSGGAYALLGTS